jgi:hypothetical protein
MWAYNKPIKDIAHFRAVCLSEAGSQVSPLDPKPQSASLRSLDWGYVKVSLSEAVYYRFEDQKNKIRRNKRSKVLRNKKIQCRKNKISGGTK